VQPCDGSHTNPGPHTSGLSLRAQPGGGGPHALASLAASNVPDAPVPAPWPLPPVTVPEAFDPPDAPVEDEPALPLVAPAVPEPLALVEDLPPQLTTKASTTSSAAPLVSDMATPKGRIIRHGPSPDEPMTSMLAPVVGLAEWIRGTDMIGPVKVLPGRFFIPFSVSSWAVVFFGR
jgi:hypothetical protein